MNTTNYPDTMSATKAEPRRWLTMRPRDGRERLVFGAASFAGLATGLTLTAVLPLSGLWLPLLLIPAIIALSMTLAMWPVAAWQRREAKRISG